jgi:ATPase family associated with various cellular activities (AAA)
MTGRDGAEPAWLTDVRLRVARRVLWARVLWAASRHPGDEAMAISHSEVDRTLQPGPSLEAAERRFYREDTTAAGLTEAIDRLAASVPDPRWDHLVNVLGLTPQDANLLALALTADAIPGMRRVFGYLHDDTVAADASIGLAAALWGWARASLLCAGSVLTRWDLARPSASASHPFSASSGWVADPLVLAQLTGDGPPAGCGLMGRDVEPVSELVLYPAELDEIVGFAGALLASGSGTCIEMELAGAVGSGKTVLAAQAAAKLGERLVSVDAATLADLPDPGPAAVRELRQARLAGGVLAWQHADMLPAAAAAAIGGLTRLMFLETAADTPAAVSPGPVRYRCPLPPLDRHMRLRLWSAMSSTPAPAAVADWALSAGEVATAAQVLPAGDAAISGTLRRSMMRPAPDLLQPMPLPYTWPDLVLASHLEEHLRELEARARLQGAVLDGWGFADLTARGRGLTALFAGPSGCGKTMAAQVLARSLGLDLYRADLAGVVNKYIGETEKHLRVIFDACKRAPVLLLFDEADALFGKRTAVRDAHDRFANIEIDYLLQCMEEFDGMAILATNRKGDLDQAFVRRLRFIVDFVLPGAAERTQLWRKALQGRTDDSGSPLVDDLDWAALGAQLDMSGADIKSAAIAAAFLARSQDSRVRMRHVLAACRRELEKRQIVVRPGQLGIDPGV